MYFNETYTRVCDYIKTTTDVAERSRFIRTFINQITGSTCFKRTTKYIDST